MFDLIIIGGSAAATTAGIYAARRGLNFKIVTKDFGGEVATSGEISNWPSIIQTDGITLAQQFKNHLASYEVKPEEGIEVEKIVKQPNGAFCIIAKRDGVTMAGDKIKSFAEEDAPRCDYEAKAVIVATGVRPRELNIPGEKEFRNKGVTYCTTCDGPLFGGKTVAVIGGGNSALEAALMLADIAKKVYVLNILSDFTGDAILVENLRTKKNVEMIHNADTREISGKEFVTGLKYKDNSPNGGGEENKLEVEGVFIHIGVLPNSALVPPETERNALGEIIVNKNCETNIPGLYAAGDVTDIPFKQIVIAAGQGAIAALSAVNYLNKFK